jgi:tRNA acetyltransferase TAN1
MDLSPQLWHARPIIPLPDGRESEAAWPSSAPRSNAGSDVLVSYPWRRFGRARREITGLLARCGVAPAHVERTAVPGIALVHTDLDGREVIARCRALFEAGQTFRFAVKWLPVDVWCDTGLDAIKAAIDEHIAGRIAVDQTWAMHVEKRRWRQYHTREIIEHLASSIDRAVDLRNPDWIVWIDVLGPRTAISLLKRDEIFSLRLPGL